jgi:hypothetical protein
MEHAGAIQLPVTIDRCVVSVIRTYLVQQLAYRKNLANRANVEIATRLQIDHLFAGAEIHYAKPPGCVLVGGFVEHCLDVGWNLRGVVATTALALRHTQDGGEEQKAEYGNANLEAAHHWGRPSCLLALGLYYISSPVSARPTLASKLRHPK